MSNSDSGYQVALLIAFMATYMTLAIILGGIDSISCVELKGVTCAGSDRIIDTNSDLVYVLSPLVIFGTVLLLLHIRDRTED